MHLLPNISVVTKESTDKSKYPIVPYNKFKACGCDCMLKQGSNKLIEKTDEDLFKFEGLLTYDKEITQPDFIDKYKLKDTSVSPLHAFVRIIIPKGNTVAFFANMNCISESQETEKFLNETWIKTTWRLDDSVEAIFTNIMLNRTKALTGGRDGHDSKNGFYKDLYDS